MQVGGWAGLAGQGQVNSLGSWTGVGAAAGCMDACTHMPVASAFCPALLHLLPHVCLQPAPPCLSPKCNQPTNLLHTLAGTGTPLRC